MNYTNERYTVHFVTADRATHFHTDAGCSELQSTPLDIRNRQVKTGSRLRTPAGDDLGPCPECMDPEGWDA